MTWHLDDFPDGAGRGGVAAGHLVVEDEQPPLEVGDVLLVCRHRVPSSAVHESLNVCNKSAHIAVRQDAGSVAFWHVMARVLSAPVKSRKARQAGGSGSALTNEAMVGGEQVLLPQGRTHNSACACPHTELSMTNGAQ